MVRIRLIRFWLAFALLLCGIIPVIVRPSNAAASEPGSSGQAGAEVIVRPALAQADVGQVRALVERSLGDDQAIYAIEPIGLAGNYRVELGARWLAGQAASILAGAPDVLYAEPVRALSLPQFSAQLVLSDPGLAQQWPLSKIRAGQAWDLARGAGVVVAVLDTGISPSHPDLAGRVLPGWDFVNNDGDPADDAGHGTFVAGVIAAAHDNAGVAGVAPDVKILPVKVLDAAGVGSTTNFARGIKYAVEAGARVINISAGGVLNARELLDEIAAAEARGVLIVASAGNEPGNHLVYPAAAPGVLGVGASTQDDLPDSQSTAGPHVDLVAPGVSVLSAWWDGESGDSWAYGHGTSAAAPFVAGTAALLLSVRPELQPIELRQILTESSRDIDRPGIDERTGFGRLDVYGATRLAVPLEPTESAEIQAVPGDVIAELSFTARGFAPGEPVTLWASSERLNRFYRDVVADWNGEVQLSLGPAYRFPQGRLQVTAIGDSSRTAARGEFVVAAQATHAAFQPVEPVEATPERVYFPETGHTLANGFKAFWEAHGGLAVFGYPISEEFVELNPDTGLPHTVQYFERNRFEYHPENIGTPYDVLLGRLGTQFAASQFPVISPPAEQNGVRYFPETGHTLSGVFLAYWENSGGLSQFGYPISEPFEQGGMLVQYFERNRFEYHPELPEPYVVLLARLGVELARQNGYLR